MPILQRLGTINTLTALLERAVRWVPPLVGALGMGGLSGWAAHATAALSAYAPFSWVIGGIFGGLLFVCGYLGFAVARQKLSQAEFTQQMLDRADLVNPLENIFTKQKIDISVSKKPPPNMVETKTFIECEIHGPANIILNGITNLIGPGRIDRCDFVVVKANHPITNAVGFTNTTFRNCLIYDVTFLIPEYLATSIPLGANWITPNSPMGTAAPAQRP